MNKMPFVDYIFVFKTCLGSAENASCLDIAFLGLCHFAGSAFIEHVKWNFALHKRCKDAQTTFTYNSKWMSYITWNICSVFFTVYLNWIKSIYVIEFIFCCRWFRVEGVGLRQVLPTPKIKYHLEVLILQELTVEDSGVYVCIVNNTVGSERVEVNLTVRSPLGVNVEPATQVIDLNRQAVFTCSVVGWPVESTSWYKNGYPLHVSHR